MIVNEFIIHCSLIANYAICVFFANKQNYIERITAYNATKKFLDEDSRALVVLFFCSKKKRESPYQLYRQIAGKGALNTIQLIDI